MLQVEIVAGPLRIEGVHHFRHIPHRRPDISGVIVVSHLNPILFCKSYQAAKLIRRFLQLLADIDEFVVVVTRLQKRNGQLARGSEDLPVLLAG